MGGSGSGPGSSCFRLKGNEDFTLTEFPCVHACLRACVRACRCSPKGAQGSGAAPGLQAALSGRTHNAIPRLQCHSRGKCCEQAAKRPRTLRRPQGGLTSTNRGTLKCSSEGKALPLGRQLCPLPGDCAGPAGAGPSSLVGAAGRRRRASSRAGWSPCSSCAWARRVSDGASRTSTTCVVVRRGIPRRESASGPAASQSNETMGAD